MGNLPKRETLNSNTGRWISLALIGNHLGEGISEIKLPLSSRLEVVHWVNNPFMEKSICYRNHKQQSHFFSSWKIWGSTQETYDALQPNPQGSYRADNPGLFKNALIKKTLSFYYISNEVKKQLRSDKRHYINTIAEEAEEAAGKGDLKTLYATTRLLSGRHTNPNRPVRDKEGKLLTSIDEQLQRWKEHFEDVLN